MKKKDTESKFRIVRKGYEPKDVDLYIAKTEKDYEAKILQQRQVIESLEREIDEKNKKIDEFDAKAKRITHALTGAVAKAEEIERLSLFKYNKEMEQLKTFHARWLTYYAKLIKKYPLTEDLEAVNRFNDKVNRILGESSSDDGGAGRFREEFSKLIRSNGALDENIEDEIPSVSPAAFIKLPEEEKPESQPQNSGKKPYKSVSYAPVSSQSLESTVSPSGFSFEEALNPKESLEEIMADLGLLMDESENSDKN